MRDVVETAEGLEAILEALDALSESCEGEAAEALDELNAEFEDGLMLLDELDPGEDGCEEELRDAMEEFAALAESYQKLAFRIPELMPLALRLKREAGQ